MKKTGLAFVMLGLLVFASPVFAGAEAKRIVEKAIKAHGGEANLAKLRTMRIKLEGTTYGPAQPDLRATIEQIWQMPNQHKCLASFNLMGMKINHIHVIDGAKGWSRLNNDETQELPKDFLDVFAEQQYANNLDRLEFLRDKASELSLLGEIKVGGKPAVGVLVKSKGHQEVKLYFDKASGLLVKREHQRFDTGAGDGIKEEVFFSDYQEKDGLKHYRKIIVLHDGEKSLDARVTEIEFFKKLDAKVFAKP